MLHVELDSYKLLTRDNILEVFMAAQYLGVKGMSNLIINDKYNLCSKYITEMLKLFADTITEKIERLSNQVFINHLFCSPCTFLNAVSIVRHF